MDMCENANSNFDRDKFTSFIESHIDKAEEV